LYRSRRSLAGLAGGYPAAGTAPDCTEDITATDVSFSRAAAS
jgi:hypothetical protein